MIIKFTVILRNIVLSCLFLPNIYMWMAGWGDPITSSGFEYAPEYFKYIRFIWIASVCLLLASSISIKLDHSVLMAAVVVCCAMLFLMTATPVHPAEFVLLYNLYFTFLLFFILLIVNVKYQIKVSDLQFVALFFVFGFSAQILSWYIGGALPSHSNPELPLPRFNGVTNDSLSTAIILPSFASIALYGRYKAIKCVTLLSFAVLTGSIFAMVMTPAAVGYCLWTQKRYREICAAFIAILFVFAVYLDIVLRYLEYKAISILTHLRFFLNLIDIDLGQPSSQCAEEFCESFWESTANLSMPFAILYFFWFVWLFLRIRRRYMRSRKLVDQWLYLFGLSLVAASIIHPIALIPFSFTAFIVLATSDLTGSLKTA